MNMIKTPPVSRNLERNASHPRPKVSVLDRRWRLPLIVVFMVIGGRGAVYLSWPGIGSASIGALIGFIIAWRLTQTLSSPDLATGLAAFPAAATSLALVSSAWVLVVLIWTWVFTRPSGTFSDQGGMLITYAVLPATALCWLMGGPIAIGSAVRALEQVHAGSRPTKDAILARSAIYLGSALTLIPLFPILWMIVA